MRHPRRDYDARIQDAARVIPTAEPVLLLRGQDKLASITLYFYAALCTVCGAHEVAARVRAHARLMRMWPVKKLPDLPPGV